MGFIGTILMLIGIVLIAVAGLKLVPAYIEYFTIKKAITEIGNSGEITTPQQIRTAFQRRADVDDIVAVQARDLDITKEDVSFAYEKRVPLFANVSVVIDFAGSSALAAPRAD
jgi:putative transposon-encoded protein